MVACVIFYVLYFVNSRNDDNTTNNYTYRWEKLKNDNNENNKVWSNTMIQQSNTHKNQTDLKYFVEPTCKSIQFRL